MTINACSSVWLCVTLNSLHYFSLTLYLLSFFPFLCLSFFLLLSTYSINISFLMSSIEKSQYRITNVSSMFLPCFCNVCFMKTNLQHRYFWHFVGLHQYNILVLWPRFLKRVFNRLRKTTCPLNLVLRRRFIILE